MSNSGEVVDSTVVFCARSFSPETGGPSRSVPALANELKNQGVETALFSSLGFLDPLKLMPESLGFKPIGSLAGMLASARATRASVEAFRHRRTAIVVDNGIWLPFNHHVANVARAIRAKRIVSPRGMLEPWALDFHRVRKAFVWSAYQKRDLVDADLIHATSDSEYESIRRAGLRNAVAIIPNGISPPSWVTSENNHASPSKVDRTRVAVHVGRMHPKKGLMMLVDAWDKLRPGGWVLMLYGPNEAGHRYQLEEKIRQLNLANTVKLHSEIDDQVKWRVMAEADLFILPSYSENFGNVVAESLFAGTPVITTTGTPWNEIVDVQCGWYVQPRADQIEIALASAVRLTDAARQTMGKAGQRWVSDRFSSSRVAAKMKRLILALNDNEWPEFVVQD